MFTKRKSTDVKAKAIVAAVCVTFILIVIVYLLFRRKKNTEVIDLNTVKSEIKDKKKQLRDRKTLLDDMKSLVATDLSEVEVLQKELTSKLTLATKQLTEKETLLKTQKSKFLATESKLATKLSNKSTEVSNLKAQISKLTEEVRDSKAKSKQLSSVLDEQRNQMTSLKGSERTILSKQVSTKNLTEQMNNSSVEDKVAKDNIPASNLSEKCNSDAIITDDNPQDYIAERSPTIIESNLEALSDEDLLEPDVSNNNTTNSFVDPDDRKESTIRKQKIAMESDPGVNEDDYASVSPVGSMSKDIPKEENYEETSGNGNKAGGCVCNDPEENDYGEENEAAISSNSTTIGNFPIEGTDYEKASRNMDNDPQETNAGEENEVAITSNLTTAGKTPTEGTDYEKAWRNMDNDPE